MDALSYDPRSALVIAGIPQTNRSLMHAIRFEVGDPAALVQVPSNTGRRRILIVRDIEMERATKHAKADIVRCPADYAPPEGLSGDRETATAQAVAGCLVQSGVKQAVGHRSLPLIYADHIRSAGIELICEPDMGVRERRMKDEIEITALRRAQHITEEAMLLACRLVANADVDRDGTLMVGDEVLTSERVRTEIDTFLLRRGFDSGGPIVAGGLDGSDCHAHGSGPLRTGEPVIIDIFPRDRQTGYHGDCTRTVVHGEVPELVRDMHAAVVSAKKKATAAVRAGVTGEAVHAATVAEIEAAGFAVGLPGPNAPATRVAITHGTGHGIGLEVHEPPLLDRAGPPLLVGDALTIEPGLYGPSVGGIRVEDMVVVTEDGCISLNSLPEGLDWRE
ncbi:MAG: M24 family metallopeptidase [Phycisphaerales bacterium]